MTTGTPEALDKAIKETVCPLVEEFCRTRGLLPELQDTLSLVTEHFAVAAPLGLTIETDPETGEQWVEISVAARGNVAEVAEARRRYNRRWLASAPKAITENVRLFLHMAPE